MKKEVFDYFLDLDSKKLPRENGVIIKSPRNISKVPDDCYKIFRIYKKDYFCKTIGDIEDNLQAIASSHLFNEIGVLSPPIYVLKENENYECYSQISQSVYLPEFDCSLLPCEIGYYDRLLSTSKGRTDNWCILYDRLYKDYFLTFMTPECLEELINMFLIDELRTESDRHMKNYFLYKNKGSKKFNGVIAIDHDLISLIDTDCIYQKLFKSFLKHKYWSNSPTLNCVYISYEDRIKRLRQMLDDGVLSEENVTALKDALTFDFPGKIKETGEYYNVKKRKVNGIYTPISFLWDYNRKELGKDLEL